MPSSKYVYANANQKTGSVIRNSSTGKPSSNDYSDERADDPDETVLEEDKDETILLSDDDDDDNSGIGIAKDLNLDAMDLDEKFAGNDRRRGGVVRPAPSPAGMPAAMRGGGASGFLSGDPLTSSTLNTQATTATPGCDKTSNDDGRVRTKERLRSRFDDSDESDGDLSEGEFLRAVARRQAHHQAMLAESQHPTRTQRQRSDASFGRNESFLQTQQQSNHSFRQVEHGQHSNTSSCRNEPFVRNQQPHQNSDNSFRQKESSSSHNQHHSHTSFHQNEHFLETQQPFQNSDASFRQNGSEETATMANRGTSSSHNQSISEPFANTEPWEQELNTSVMMKSTRTGYPQKAPQKDCHIQEYPPGHQGKQPTSNSLPSVPYNNDQQKDQHRLEQQPNQQGERAYEKKLSNHHSLPSYPNNAPQQDYHSNHQSKQVSYDNHRNEYSNHRAKQASSNTQPYHQDTSAVSNPYHRKQPLPPAKNAAANVPKISLENLKSGKKSGRNSNSHEEPSSSTNNGETWQADAFRSSLLDLLRSFPSNYFDSPDEETTDDGPGSSLFAPSATANIDGDTPRSTTSQSAASAQLQRKRFFDAASRSLARLAIASRHSSTKNVNQGSQTSGGSSHDEGSPDFNPPSPRSLPSYMSVLNVYDDSSLHGGSWGGNVNEIFSGHSVHGRNARTVRLSSNVRDGNENPPRRTDDALSSNPFFSWTTEELAFGSMMLAAQVCYEASCDPNFELNASSGGESESCRVAGFTQNHNKGNGKIPVVSSALVESSLEFLATSFACLESDFVYSVLKSSLKLSAGVAVFDALGYFAPVKDTNFSHAVSTHQVCAIPVLSLLALSRGLEAALYVARYATSLDPSSACATYSSPHYSCVGGISNCTVDTGIDGYGGGWQSALGRDLGLNLEINLDSRPRHVHLSNIAKQCFDFILEYDPMLVDDGVSERDDSSLAGRLRGNSRGGLYVDTQATSQGRQAMDGVVCRQPSVMKDRLYAANVEFLSSMIHIGNVSGWLSSVPISEGNDLNGPDCCARTVERMTQKLFYVIETRARLRRSTNQNTVNNEPGDSEAVCAASLSLLILALPKHVSQSVPSSLSTSFRQMGNSTGTIEDLLQSPLVRNMAEMALSWQEMSPRRENGNESVAVMELATRNAIYVLSDVCIAGGASLISSHFPQRLDDFLQTVIKRLCNRGKSRANIDCLDNSTIGDQGILPPLLFLLRLHSGLPILTRKFLTKHLEQSSSIGGDCTTCLFVSGLLHLSANEMFSTSSCASALLRALIGGNPADRTQDRLSGMILNSFSTDQAGSAIEGLIISLIEATYSSVQCNAPSFNIRWQSRTCSLGDLLGVCTSSFNTIRLFALSLSDDVVNLFATAIECDQRKDLCMDTLNGSAKLSLLFLFASFTNNVHKIPNDQYGTSIATQQMSVKEKLFLPISNVVSVLEVAMAQGMSADMTHRALKLQDSLLSLCDERSLAFTFTKASNSMARKELALRDKLTKLEMKLNEMTSKYHHIEVDRDNLCSSFQNQRLAYERRLEWTRSEAQMIARHASEIHVDERKRAEERYEEEKESRMKIEQANKQLARQTASDESRIKELEELLSQERKTRRDFEHALGSCKNELSTASEELARTSSAYHDLQGKFSRSEERVSELTASSENSKANLEDTCGKLIKLATIYKSKESEMDKYKAELRSAVNTANRHADTAIQKYEYSKQQNQSLSKKFEEASKELKDIKAHRAGVQRMRKNAPVAYLNQLHNDPRIKEKKTSRRNHSGKENARR